MHAGGDSKRLPWANAIGKPFIPLPFLACLDPDGPTPTLFDHIVAISAPVVPLFGKLGGLFIMTGDLLPCFDSGRLSLPEDGALVVTVPSPLDVASRHGVIICRQPMATEGCSLVDDLLQKPSVEEMVARGAVIGGGAALLDTGVYAVRGSSWQDLICLALREPSPVRELVEAGEEMSLYEELAGAWVPNRHQWLQERPSAPSWCRPWDKRGCITPWPGSLCFFISVPQGRPWSTWHRRKGISAGAT